MAAIFHVFVITFAKFQTRPTDCWYTLLGSRVEIAKTQRRAAILRYITPYRALSDCAAPHRAISCRLHQAAGGTYVHIIILSEIYAQTTIRYDNLTISP